MQRDHAAHKSTAASVGIRDVIRAEPQRSGRRHFDRMADLVMLVFCHE